MPGLTVVWNLVLHAAKNRWVKLSAQALVVLALIGGLFYVASFQKSVALSVDGQERTVSMFGSTVADALTAANVTVGPEDQVSPALDAPIAAGQTIEVLTEKGVKVSIDGADRVVNTTGLTVEDLIQQLGITAGAKVSLDEDTLLNGLNSTLTITTADAIADAKAAAKAKAEAKKKAAAEKVAAAKKAAAQKAEAARAAAAAQAEAARQAAAEKAAAAQEAAEAREAAAAKAAAQKEAAAQAAAAQKTQAASSSSTSTATKVTTSNVSGTWAALAQCESGGNWSINTGNGYYGGLQFSLGSWQAVGGTQYAAYPHLASPSQQIAAAEKLRASGGWGHWPACAAKLGLL